MPCISIVTSVEAAPAWSSAVPDLPELLLVERPTVRHRRRHPAAAAAVTAATAAGRGHPDEHHSEYESQFHSIPSMASASSDDRNGRHPVVANRVDEELGPHQLEELSKIHFRNQNLLVSAKDVAGVAGEGVQIAQVGVRDLAAPPRTRRTPAATGPYVPPS